VSGARRFDDASAVERLTNVVPSFALSMPPVSDLVAFVREKILDDLFEGLAEEGV
jgi:hypothetical protein